MAIRLLRLIAFLIASVLLATPYAMAADATTVQVDALGPGSFQDHEAAMAALVATGDPRVVPILQALADGNLYLRRSDGKVALGTKAADGLALKDPLDGIDLGTAATGDVDKIKVNNGLRGKIRTAIGQMTLLSTDRTIRLSAAQSVLKTADPGTLELLKKALGTETDPEIKNTMELAEAVIVLKTDTSVDEKRAAIATVAGHGDRDALTVLTGALGSAPEELKPDI